MIIALTFYKQFAFFTAQKERMMTIYQVLDEQNHPVYETASFENALLEAEMLNYSSDEHYFFVETAELVKH